MKVTFRSVVAIIFGVCTVGTVLFGYFYYQSKRILPPEEYGLTNRVTLSGIGVEANFPEGISIVPQGNPRKAYSIFSQKDSLGFVIHEYADEDIIEWFNKIYGPISKYESFSSDTHKGYIFYTGSETDIFGVYYVSEIRPSQLLVIQGNPAGPSFFNNNLAQVKSFLKSMTVIDPLPIDQPEETVRVSQSRVTLRENYEYGIRITVPELVETRLPHIVREDGTFEYPDWKKVDFSISSEKSSITIQEPNAGDETIWFLYPLLRSLTRDEVISIVLPGGGYCSTGWQVYDSCQSDVCYSKNDVKENLQETREENYGSYQGTLYHLDNAFSQRFECAAEDRWFLETGNNHYILTTVNPNSEIIRLESL